MNDARTNAAIVPTGGGEPLTLADLAIIGNSAPLPGGEPLPPDELVAFQRGKLAATDAIVTALLGMRR